MSQNFDNSVIQQEKFEKSIEWLTLTFKDLETEKKYHEKYLKDAIKSNTFKIGLAMLLFDIIFRRIESLCFSLFEIEAVHNNLNVEVMHMALLFVTLVFEIFFAYFEWLNIFKGFLAMVYMFFMVIHLSYVYNIETPSNVPMYF